MIALDRASLPRSRGARVTLLGEAKATDAPRGAADLARLDHIRELLVAQGRDAGDAVLALFSRDGFDAELRTVAGGRLPLIDLPTLYGV